MTETDFRIANAIEAAGDAVDESVIGAHDSTDIGAELPEPAPGATVTKRARKAAKKGAKAHA